MANMITYEGIYDILRKEKIYPELQKIPQNFLNDVINYLNEKASILESQRKKDSIFAEREAEKTARQLENIKKMLKELYEKRENKILKLALIASRSGSLSSASMIEEEKEMYSAMVENLNFYRESILKRILNKKLPLKEKEDLKTVLFTNPVPRFIGTDNKKYGPFEEKNTASLPSNVAELLIKSKRAEEI